MRNLTLCLSAVTALILLTQHAQPAHAHDDEPAPLLRAIPGVITSGEGMARYTLNAQPGPGHTFNRRAPQAQRLTLTLDAPSPRAFAWGDFEIEGDTARLTFDAPSPPAGELSALVCRADLCETVTVQVSWREPEPDALAERASAPEPRPELALEPAHGADEPLSLPDEDLIGAPPAEPTSAPSRFNASDADLLIPEVVVASTSVAGAPEDATTRTQHISRQQIEQRNARNLAEVVAYTTGARVETSCQSCGFTQLRLNGLDGAYTQLLIDGLPSLSALAGVYGLEQLPAELIERVEIVKGGGSALYGPGAVAGVINVITRQPTEGFAQALASYEQVGWRAPDLRVSADGALVSDSGRLAMHLFATTRRRQDLDLNDDAISDLTRINQLAAGVTVYARPLSQGQLQLKLHALREDRRGGDRLDLPPHAAAVAEQLSTERLQAEARWTHALSPQVRYALAYVLAYTDRRSYYGGTGGALPPSLPADDGPLDEEQRERFEAREAALGGYGRTRNPSHVADARLHLNYDALGAQEVVVGAQFLADVIDDRYLGYDRVIDDTFSVLGAFAQQRWAFAGWGESVLGARLDKHSALDAPILSPRAALRLVPGANLQLRTALSTGFRAPQAFDEDLHIELVAGAARQIINAPGLRPERSQSLAQQIAWERKLTPELTLRLGLNGYLTRLRDAFVLVTEDDPSTAETELVRRNRGTTLARGAEVEASVSATRWALRGGWTIERADNDDPDDDFGQTRILRTPIHYGYLDALLKSGGLQLQAGVNLTGPMLAPRYDANAQPLEVNTTPWFVELNLNAGYALAWSDGIILEPFIGARNLLDSRQRDLDRGPARDASYVYGPSLPRTIFVGVKGGL